MQLVVLSPNRLHGSPKWVSAIRYLRCNRSIGEDIKRTILGFRLIGFATSHCLELSEFPLPALSFSRALSGAYGHFIAYKRLI
jgi:hypothetical protein